MLSNSICLLLLYFILLSLFYTDFITFSSLSHSLTRSLTIHVTVLFPVATLVASCLFVCQVLDRLFSVWVKRLLLPLYIILRYFTFIYPKKIQGYLDHIKYCKSKTTTTIITSGNEKCKI